MPLSAPAVERTRYVVKESLSFGITGEFITKSARELFFIDHKPYSVVEELLLGCMCGTDMDQGTLKLMAQDVILGKAEFRGNSWDGSFVYATLDDPAPVNIFEEYSKICREKQDADSEFRRMAQRYNAMFDALRLWSEGDIEAAIDECDADAELKDTLLKIMSQYGECRISYGPHGYKEVFFGNDSEPIAVAPPSTGDAMLDDFFVQRVAEEKHGEGYGWLEPNGTFHPVDWAAHQEFAYKVIEERGWWNEFDRWDDNTSPINCNGDFLTTVKGWVLLHNPGRGVAVVTRDEGKRLTKAQREFLFDYFTQRGMPDKAKLYLQDE